MFNYKLIQEDKVKLKEYEEDLRASFKDNSDDENRRAAFSLWLRWKCLTDLFFLNAEVLGLREAKDKKTGRRILDEKLHRPMCEFLQNDEDMLMLYPRAHMKSWFLKTAIVQAVLRNPNGRYALWTKTTSLARKELKAIKAILMNPLLMETFPDIIPPVKQWVKNTVDVLEMRRPLQDYKPQEGQVEVWGVDSVVVGHHYDIHYYDDVLDERTITTSEQMEKLETWWQHVQAIKELHAPEKMIGTRYHYHDLYGRVIEEGFFDRVITRKAIENGKPIYSRFTLKDLDKLKKRMGDYVFSMQYMNDPVAMQDRIFVPPYPIYKQLPAKVEYYLTVDPATGKKYSNKTGICVAAIEPRKQDVCYFVEAYRINEPPDVVAGEIVKKIVQYNPQKVGIEYGLQEGLKPLIEYKLQKSQAVTRPVFVSIPTNIKNMSKPQKISRMLGAMVRENRVLFRDHMRELFHQMDFLNPNTDSNEDDIVDAANMMMMVVPAFEASRWWLSDAHYDYGFTMEGYMKKLRQKERKWGSTMVC